MHYIKATAAIIGAVLLIVAGSFTLAFAMVFPAEYFKCKSYSNNTFKETKLDILTMQCYVYHENTWYLQSELKHINITQPKSEG